jgi:hypothetical protein
VYDHLGESPLGAANLHDRIIAPKASLCFGLVEILRSARYAISLRLLSIQVFVYAPGYAIYALLAYLSFWLAGRSPAGVWAEWGLLPCLFAAITAPPLSAWMVYSLGLVALALAFILSNAAGSRLLWMKWRGHHDYSVREAYDFATGKISVILMAPSALVFLVVLFAGGGWLVGMVGRIPYIGELIVTGFAWLWVLAALVMLLIFCIAGLTFILTPAIVATTGEDALEAILQTASIFWRQPWRLLLYLAGVVAAATAGLIVLAFLVKCAFFLMDALFATAMGADYQSLSTQAQYLLQSWSATANRWLVSVAPGPASSIFFSRAATPLELTPWFDVLAHIFALSLLFSAVWVFAYPLAIINGGLTLTYLRLRQIIDSEKPFSGDKSFSGENPLERCQADEPTSS